MRKMYKTMLIFFMYLKLDLFFVLVTAAEVFGIFNIDTPKSNNYTFVLSKGLYYFHMAVTIMILLLEILAYYSSRKEWRVGMIAYLTLTLCTVIDFIILLNRATINIKQSWYFFILIDVMAIILLLLTWIWGLLVYRNFNQGLAELLEEDTNRTRRPFTIEDSFTIED